MHMQLGRRGVGQAGPTGKRARTRAPPRSHTRATKGSTALSRDGLNPKHSSLNGRRLQAATAHLVLLEERGQLDLRHLARVDERPRPTLLDENYRCRIHAYVHGVSPTMPKDPPRKALPTARYSSTLQQHAAALDALVREEAYRARG
jgi:hypothetical protein